VVGTATDQPLADRLLATLDGDATDLTGQLGLGGLAGLLKQTTLLVGNDSGPRHLAAAVGTATVAVHWGVSLGSYGPLYRARHRAPTAWRLHCPICGANGLQEDCRPFHEASFVADVTVDEVLAEAVGAENPVHLRRPGCIRGSARRDDRPVEPAHRLLERVAGRLPAAVPGRVPGGADAGCSAPHSPTARPPVRV
jgi:hypothetical protein